jgi:ketosteroid isomerase-like protein
MSRENVEIVRSLYGRWERGDFDTAGWFDPEVEFHRIGSADDMTRMSGTWQGVEAMWNALREWLGAWEDIRLKAERVSDVGDRVLVFSRQTGQGKRSGAPLDHAQGDVFTLRQGKIVRWDAYWDRGAALEAAGLSE